MRNKLLSQRVIWAVFMSLCLGFVPVFSQQPLHPASPNTWSIIATYTIPGKASGLAWDGSYLYSGIYGANGDRIYKINPSTGVATLQCNGPFDDAYGLTYHSPNLVTINQPGSSSMPSAILEFSMAGAQVSTITLPDHYMSGVAYDNGTYWVGTYYPDPGMIYHVSSTGAILGQFAPPGSQTWDICMQGSDLWIADYYGNSLFKVSNTGTLIESHPSQSINPSGIVFDGTYLWYVDGQLGSNSTLYKVDLSGAGTPAITVPVTSHNYNTVTVGNSSTWNCQVQNSGTANLVINSVNIPSGQPISTSLSMPATITPGNSINIPLTYNPTNIGILNTIITIHSTDPVHPTVPVSLTGNAVYSGPHIILTNSSHDWGERRAGAYSRWSLPVANLGNQSLTVSNLSFSDNHFFADEAVNLPISISTLDTISIPVWFHPTAGEDYSCIMEVHSNDPAQPVFQVTLQGSGIVQNYPIGSELWHYSINAGFDNSPKAIHPLADITGDSVSDVIICSEDNYIRCFNGNASGVGDVLWATFVYSGAVYQQNALATIPDINLDGYEDVIVGTAWGDESIIALSGKTGSQIWKHDTHEYGDGGWVYQVDVKYDYNNDGFPDVLAATGDDGNGTGPKRVYCLNGKTGTPIWKTATVGPVFSVIGIEDFTNDNKPDVLAGASNANENEGRVYGIDGSNGIIKWTSIPAGSSTWALMQIDDINSDGKKDVASGDFSGHVYYHSSVNGMQLKSKVIGNVIILRFEDVGDVNADFHPDVLIGHSGNQAMILDGQTGNFVWTKNLADKSWCVTSMGDITRDKVNDVGIGTLYSNNFAYFMDGTNGTELEKVGISDAVDAVDAIPDIVGDGTMELLVGGRNGAVLCLSGGYDPFLGIGSSEMTALVASVYPNPCEDKLYLDIFQEQAGVLSISLLDITGKEMNSPYTKVLVKGWNQFVMSRSDLGMSKGYKGLGIVQLRAGDTLQNIKVLFR